jgi:Protein of unknown function (DUF1376)
MSEHAPAPLTPAGCDMSGLRYMPLILAKIRYSRLWARARYEPRLGFAAVNLWMAAWLSVPAASLEDDDFLLAELAMCDVETWQAIRDEVLHGWVRCSDGRLYHPVIAELALDVWRKRARYRGMAPDCPADDEPADDDPAETDASNGQPTPEPAGAKEPDPLPSGIVPSTPASTVVSSPPAVVSPPLTRAETQGRLRKKEREGEKKKVKRKGVLRTPSPAGGRGARAGARAGECVPDPLFNLFWERYPLPIAPRFARMEWDAAIARGATGDEILDGMARHRFASKRNWVKHPANWLAGECWKTEGVPPETTGNGWLDIISEFIHGEAPIVDLHPQSVPGSLAVGHG